MSLVRTLMAVLAVSVVVATPALAQWREGQPPVLRAPAQADPDAPANAVLTQFAAWNRNAGAPKILVFWNRQLTDDTATRTVEHVHETEDGQSGTSTVNDTTQTQFGSASRTNEEGVTTSTRDRTTSNDVVTGGLYHRNLDPAASRLLETTFTNLFLQTGASIVDRDALIRRVSVGASAADRQDLQFIEAKALNERVVYLIEVLPDPNAQSPTGMVFSVNIRHLPTSTVVARFMTSGAVPAGRTHYVPTSSGFRRVTDDRSSPERVAAQVAVDVMERLSRRGG